MITFVNLVVTMLITSFDFRKCDYHKNIACFINVFLSNEFDCYVILLLLMQNLQIKILNNSRKEVTLLKTVIKLIQILLEKSINQNILNLVVQELYVKLIIFSIIINLMSIIIMTYFSQNVTVYLLQII